MLHQVLEGQLLKSYLIIISLYTELLNPKEIDAKYKLLKFDITEYQDAETITDYLISKHGKIDILVNNAGISITGPVESSEMSDI